MKNKKELNRKLKILPSVEAVLIDERITGLHKIFSHDYLGHLIKKEIGNLRDRIRKDQIKGEITRDELSDMIIGAISKKSQVFQDGSIISAVNATGVILHTGLGRAPLNANAVQKVKKIISGYTTLEIDRDSGMRGRREKRFEDLLCLLSGAESATIVNNNAAAVLISLNTLAKNKEVIISRGELVEIGGSFRMPEIMEASGARMIEVGTTNKTKLSDYAKAINRKTGAILKVHSSNYRVMGFSQSVSLAELHTLSRSKKVPVIYDLGGGVFYDLKNFGLPHEPVVDVSVRAGADVVTFSGDKVMGGPQAGVIVGREKYLEKIKTNPIARALRCDKLVLAAFEGTLLEYAKGEKGFKSLPSTKMMLESKNNVLKRAEAIISQLNKFPVRKISIKIEETEAEIGSGAMPLERIPSGAVSIKSKILKSDNISNILRMNTPPIFGYIKNDTLYLDMRTVFKNQIKHLVNSLNKLIELH
ncbi:L-seryl-tRNA(Sec) selenium transferase [candidate division KSB1 bacterium]